MTLLWRARFPFATSAALALIVSACSIFAADIETASIRNDVESSTAGKHNFLFIFVCVWLSIFENGWVFSLSAFSNAGRGGAKAF